MRCLLAAVLCGVAAAAQRSHVDGTLESHLEADLDGFHLEDTLQVPTPQAPALRPAFRMPKKLRLTAEDALPKTLAACGLPATCEDTGEKPPCNGDMSPVYIHTNLLHTGTSHIGHTLSKNRDLLKSMGVMYAGTHSSLATYLERVPTDVLEVATRTRHWMAEGSCPDAELMNVQQLMSKVHCAPCATPAVLSSELFYTLSPRSMRALSHMLRPRPVNVIMYYRNLRDMAVSHYRHLLRTAQIGSGACSEACAYDPSDLGVTSSLREYISRNNPKTNPTDGFGAIGNHLVQQISRNAALFTVTLIDYEGASKLGDVTDSLLRSVGLPDLSIGEIPERASNRSAFGMVHETFGDELLRQTFKYIYDYALEERNLSLVGGRTNDLNFNNLTIAKYWGELPTSMVSLADLADQARVLDNTVRRMFSSSFWHEKGYWHDQQATQRAIDQEPRTAVDLNHTTMRELCKTDLWKARSPRIVCTATAQLHCNRSIRHCNSSARFSTLQQFDTATLQPYPSPYS